MLDRWLATIPPLGLAILFTLMTWSAKAQYAANQFVHFDSLGNVIVGYPTGGYPICSPSCTHGTGVLDITGSAAFNSLSIGDIDPGRASLSGQLITTGQTSIGSVFTPAENLGAGSAGEFDVNGGSWTFGGAVGTSQSALSVTNDSTLSITNGAVVSGTNGFINLGGTTTISGASAFSAGGLGAFSGTANVSGESSLNLNGLAVSGAHDSLTLGTVTLSGASTLTNTGSAATFVVGPSFATGSGILTVADGSSIITAGGFVGPNQSGNGIGTLALSGGSGATILGQLSVGPSFGSSGSGAVTLTGGSTLVANTMTVGSGPFLSPATGTGILTVDDGSWVNLTTSPDPTLFGAGALQVIGGGLVSITNSGRMTAAGVVDAPQGNCPVACNVTPVGNANISVDGVGSSLTSTQNVVIGETANGAQATGTLSLTNGGTLNIINGAGLILGSDGTLILDALPGQTPNIATAGAVQLGGTIKVQTAGTANIAPGTFIPLIVSSSINFTNPASGLELSAPNVDPVTGDYDYFLTTLQGGAGAHILVPQALGLVPQLQQQTVAGNTVNVFGLGPSCSQILRNAEFKITPLDINPANGLEETMFATFTPGFGLTLSAAAAVCNLSNFDWEQKVVHETTTGLKNLTNADGSPLQDGHLDPPQGGYNRNPKCRFFGFPISTPNNSFPYYWDPNAPEGNCYSLAANENDTTLFFSDRPNSPGLSPDDYLEFFTCLVGVPKGALPTSPLDCLDAKLGWTWRDTFDQSSIFGPAIGGAFCITSSGTRVACTTNNSIELIDPTGSTGGVTIVSIGGIPVQDVPEPPTGILLICGLSWLIILINRHNYWRITLRDTQLAD